MALTFTLLLSTPAVAASSFFFFFQAEDGIRDHCVTGVQTCALPISPPDRLVYSVSRLTSTGEVPSVARPAARQSGFLLRSLEPRHRHRSIARAARRSEERRVGKEGRSRWSPYH